MSSKASKSKRDLSLKKHDDDDSGDIATDLVTDLKKAN